MRVTSVVVTHDMRSARRVGQRILMLHDRRIYTAGPAEETKPPGREIFLSLRDHVERSAGRGDLKVAGARAESERTPIDPDAYLRAQGISLTDERNGTPGRASTTM